MAKNSKKTNFQLEKIAIKATRWVGTPQSILVHTILFIGIFALRFFGVGMDNILLILTTAVSLEAIYLAIFIQMTVNRTTSAVEDIQEDVEDIQEDLGELQAEEIPKSKRITPLLRLDRLRKRGLI